MKQTKANQEQWHKIRNLFKLYNHNKICFLFPYFFIFQETNLLNMHKKCIFLQENEPQKPQTLKEMLRNSLASNAYAAISKIFILPTAL